MQQGHFEEHWTKTHSQGCIRRLDDRTRDREVRQVEGTYSK